MKKEVIGIDVSKSTLDLWLHHAKEHSKIQNSEAGYQKLLQWIKEELGMNLSDVAFCLEHTGNYSLPVCRFLSNAGARYYLVSGLLVKRSLGIVRGKNDKIDAQNLASFAYRHQDQLVPYHLPDETLIRLNKLFSYRALLVRQCSAHKTNLKGMRVDIDFQEDLLVQCSEQIIEDLQARIRKIEQEMNTIIQGSSELKTTYESITSIKGVGPILAIAMITSTNNFKAFKSWRAFACYAGIAPFEHQSGTSYKGRTRISHLGNRAMKTLLSQAAATAIQFNPEMRLYYQKRLAQGKNKMSTLNIIRNKLVSRMFAVAAQKRAYVDIHKYAA